MRDLTSIERTKRVFQLEEGEFKKGNWLDSIEDGDLVEIKYTGRNRILEIRDAKITSVKQRYVDYGEEGNQTRNF